MKKNIAIIILLLTATFQNQGFSQTITDDQKQQILQTLQFNGFISMDSAKQWGKVFDMLVAAERYKVSEVIPYIEERIWQCDDGMMDKMISVLFELKSPHFQNIAKAVIDTSEKILAGGSRKNKNYCMNPKFIGFDAVYWLFKFGDYTYADKFVQYIQENGGLKAPGIRSLAIPRMAYFAKAVPAYRDFVRNELLDVMNTDTTQRGMYRGRSAIEMILAIDYYLPDLVTFFENTNDKSGTNSYIAGKIAPLKYPPFEASLKSKLLSNQELLYHDNYINLLLENYGSPGNYQFVVTYAANQQNKRKQTDALDALGWYIPDTPSVSIPVNVLLDSLVSYKEQCSNYNWLGDKNFGNELSNHLANAKKHLNKSDSVNCSKEVEKFQEKVNTEYEKTIDNEKKNKPKDKRFVTVEGWKFLYYNAQYIMDRLPGKEKK